MNLNEIMKHHINSEQSITQIIASDSWMMDVLNAAEEVNLPNWWIGAGFLRNKIWDAIEGVESAPTRDVDLVYFNANNISAETDWNFDVNMKKTYPFAEWEIRNQARMHYKNNSVPFTSTEDGISSWVETATCIAVRLNKGSLEYLFCHGTDDLFNLVARPIPAFQSKERIKIFNERVDNKKWKDRWPNLKVMNR